MSGAAPVESRRERRLRRRRRRVAAWTALALAVATIVTVSIVLVAKTASMSGKVFGGGGSIVGLVAPPNTPLRTDADGRVNVLIFGTSQDDVGHAQGEGGQGMW